MDAMLRDPGLAADGRRQIDFAERRMPVLRAVRAELERTRPLAGVRIAACLHVTTETANLCRTLVAGGAQMALAASNPLSTKDDVAAAIHADLGVGVFAVHGCDRAAYYRQIEAALAIEPTLVLDDGADLTSRLHADDADQLANVVGGTEVTTSGVTRLRNMEREGTLAYPMLALNEASTKYLFDNRYGTGQNTIDGLLRATNVMLAGAVFVVVGFGWVGRGIAMRARGMGARVIVVELDAVRALEALMEGYQVLPIAAAAEVGDVFVTATGNRHAIGLPHLRSMKRGAIVANSGHFDHEIDVAGLREAAVERRDVRADAVEYVLDRGTGGGVVVLAEGRLVGQSCAEASPAEVMDLSFSTQALAVAHLAAHGRDLAAGVHRVPVAIEDRVARGKLESVGVHLDELTPDQHAYLTGWRSGT
jgi:adenosylhomocysteinase